MVIRMRHTRAHTKNRRSHHGLTAPALSTCAHCGEMHRPHHMCLNCGYYKGRQVMDLEALKAKRDARIKAKKERIKAEGAQDAPASEATETAPEEQNKALEAGDETKAIEEKK